MRDPNLATHEFWLWEYQRRNSTYRSDFDGFLAVFKKFNEGESYPGRDFFQTMWKNHLLIKCDFEFNGKREKVEKMMAVLWPVWNFFCQKHHRSPTDYNIGADISDILTNAYENNDDFFSTFTYFSHGKFNLPHIDHYDGTFTVDVDTRIDIDTVIREIKYYYYNTKSGSEYDKSFIYDVDANIAWDELKKDTVKKDKKERIRNYNKYRAVGLWTYDYCTNNCTTPDEAIQKFINMYSVGF